MALNWVESTPGRQLQALVGQALCGIMDSMRARCPSAFGLPLALTVIQACSGTSAGESRAGGARSDTGGAQSESGGTSLGGVSSGTYGSTGGTSAVQGGAASATAGATNAGGEVQSGGTRPAATRTEVVPGGAAATSGGGSAAGGGKSTGGTKGAGGQQSNGGVGTTGGTRTGGGAGTTGGTRSNGGASTTGGTSAAGGSNSGAHVCGTAAEDASVTLRCPEGQIVDSVVFASYGTPAGSCASFTTGSCDATSSEAMVESMCLGRSACTVPATNGLFGDPCRSTTKRLNVEVACIVGTPVVTPTGPYKGVANSPASEIESLGATWCYNWGTTPKSTDCADPYFVPMVWGSGDVANAIRAIGAAGYTTVLGFNEPNKSDQANMSVADAIALWPAMTSDPSIRVGSPAVSDDGRSWLVEFMTQAKSNGLRVDFIAMHWYGWNAGSCVASQLEGAVNWASQWGLPIWITEFGCMGSSNSDEQTVLEFFNDAIEMLDSHPLVERYAWYPWNTYNELYKANASGTRVITSLGNAFAAAPQFRP